MAEMDASGQGVRHCLAYGIAPREPSVSLHLNPPNTRRCTLYPQVFDALVVLQENIRRQRGAVIKVWSNCGQIVVKLWSNLQYLEGCICTCWYRTTRRGIRQSITNTHTPGDRRPTAENVGDSSKSLRCGPSAPLGYRREYPARPRCGFPHVLCGCQDRLRCHSYLIHSILFGSKGGWAKSTSVRSPPSALIPCATPAGTWTIMPGLSVMVLSPCIIVPPPLTM